MKRKNIFLTLGIVGLLVSVGLFALPVSASLKSREEKDNCGCGLDEYYVENENFLDSIKNLEILQYYLPHLDLEKLIISDYEDNLKIVMIPFKNSENTFLVLQIRDNYIEKHATLEILQFRFITIFKIKHDGKTQYLSNRGFKLIGAYPPLPASFEDCLSNCLFEAYFANPVDLINCFAICIPMCFIPPHIQCIACAACIGIPGIVCIIYCIFNG